MMSKRELHKSISPLKKKKAAPKPRTPSPRKKLPEDSPKSPKIYDYFVRDQPRLKNLPLSRKLSIKKTSEVDPSTSVPISELSTQSLGSDKTSKVSKGPKPSTSNADVMPISELSTQSLGSVKMSKISKDPKPSTSCAAHVPNTEQTTKTLINLKTSKTSKVKKRVPKVSTPNAKLLAHSLDQRKKEESEVKTEQPLKEESFGRPTIIKSTKRSLNFDSEVSPLKKRRISLDTSVNILLKNISKFNQIYETLMRDEGDLEEVKKSFLKIYCDEIEMDESTSNAVPDPDSSVLLIENKIETISVHDSSSEEFIDERNCTSVKLENAKPSEVVPDELSDHQDTLEESGPIEENAVEGQRRQISSQVTIERVTPKHDVQKKRTPKKPSSRTKDSEDIENTPPKNIEEIKNPKPPSPVVRNGNLTMHPVVDISSDSSNPIDPMKCVKTEFKTPKRVSIELSDALIFAIVKSEKYLNFFFNNINRKFSASYQNLSLVERRVYLNLLGRKWYWIRKDKIKYFGIEDTETALEPLFHINFIKHMDQSCPLEDILQNMNVEELTTLTTLYNLDKNGPKESKIKNLLQLAKRKGFQFSESKLEDKIKAKAIEMVGNKTIKLTEEPRSFFLKLIVAATCPYYQDEESERFSRLRIALEKLNKKEAFLLPLRVMPRKLFKDVSHFESYFKSIQIKGELQDAKLKKNWDQVVVICKKAFDELKSFLSNHVVLFMIDDTQFNFGKFTAGSVLSYCLSSSIDVMKRQKDYDLALESIELLLSQHHFVQRRRATWYEQKVLILERYKKSTPLEIFEILKRGLQDPQLSLLGRRILSKKAEPYITPKSKKLKADKKEELQQLISIPLLNIPIEEIYCKSKPSVSTSKKQYFEKDLGADVLYGSVEEIASEFYGTVFPHRVHDEGRMFKNLALSLFYPVIYHDIPGMFVSEMQDRPLDWGGTHFFQARIEKFMERRQTLINSSFEQIESELKTLSKNLKNSMQTFLKFDERDVVFMMGLLKAMKIENFTNAALYLLENFSERKSGLPDLTLYNETNCAFVEVKGPTDSPSVNQILWLEKLSEFGFTRLICKVTSKVAGVSQKPLLGEETQSD